MLICWSPSSRRRFRAPRESTAGALSLEPVTTSRLLPPEGPNCLRLVHKFSERQCRCLVRLVEEHHGVYGCRGSALDALNPGALNKLG